MPLQTLQSIIVATCTVAALGALPAVAAVAHDGDHAGSLDQPRLTGSETVSASVPTRATSLIAGKRVAARVARNTRLQQLTSEGWVRVDGARSKRSGAVSYTVHPSVTSQFRVSAPATTVPVTRLVDGTVRTKTVRLPSWAGPVVTVSIAQPSPGAGQQPTQGPTQGTGTPRLRLLTKRPASSPPAYLGDVSVDNSGRYVVFSSAASDLVPGDDNGRVDVFVSDTVAGTVELASRATDGSSGNEDSRRGDISPDGRYVVFDSFAGDLVPGASGQTSQIYMFDRVTQTVELVSATPAGVEGDSYSRRPAVSRDGAYVVFETLAPNLTLAEVDIDQQVVRHERSSGINQIVSFPVTFDFTGASSDASISDDGSLVAFSSFNDQLVYEDSNQRGDVFLRDFGSGVKKLISRRPDGTGVPTDSERPIISGDGGSVIWYSRSSGVVVGDDNDSPDTFRYDVQTRTNSLLSKDAQGRSLNGTTYPLGVSPDGRRVAVASTWGARGTGYRLYRWDTATGSIGVPWVGADGLPPAISPTGDAGLGSAGAGIAFSTPSQLVPDDRSSGDDLYLLDHSG